MVSCLTYSYNSRVHSHRSYGYWEITTEGTHISIFFRYHRVSVKLQCMIKTQVIKPQAAPPITSSTWIPLASCRHRLVFVAQQGFFLSSLITTVDTLRSSSFDTKSKTIIQKLKGIFTRLDIPKRSVRQWPRGILSGICKFFKRVWLSPCNFLPTTSSVKWFSWEEKNCPLPSATFLSLGQTNHMLHHTQSLTV